MHVLWLFLGLVSLTAGAELLVRSASKLAMAVRISPLVVGLTVVAYGTSTPELVVSVQSALRDQADIALGNVVGSNIFSIMGVLGIACLLPVDGIAVSQTVMHFDIPVMIGVAVACLPIFFTAHLIARWEGGLFLAYCCAYTTYLVLSSTQAAFARTFGVSVIVFGVPLTVITLMLGVVVYPNPADNSNRPKIR
jgi:cation:H+ antiporter